MTTEAEKLVNAYAERGVIENLTGGTTMKYYIITLQWKSKDSIQTLRCIVEGESPVAALTHYHAEGEFQPRDYISTQIEKVDYFLRK